MLRAGAALKTRTTSDRVLTIHARDLPGKGCIVAVDLPRPPYVFDPTDPETT